MPFGLRRDVLRPSDSSRADRVTYVELFFDLVFVFALSQLSAYLYQNQTPPAIDVQFNIGARKINEEVSEIELKISVTAKSGEGTAYIVEVAYCGLVGMRNMAEDQKHAFTYAEAPRILFPFARRVIADAVRDAGFAPLLLDPIDFNGLYIQQLQQQQLQQQGDAPVGQA